jgi:hypothetical protein
VTVPSRAVREAGRVTWPSLVLFMTLPLLVPGQVAQACKPIIEEAEVGGL